MLMIMTKKEMLMIITKKEMLMIIAKQDRNLSNDALVLD